MHRTPSGNNNLIAVTGKAPHQNGQRGRKIYISMRPFTDLSAKKS